MILLKKIQDLNAYLADAKVKNQRIGFVPTMGALHNGHLSLIQKSKKSTSVTVSSIFVNPTQFNNPEDLKKYPVSLEQDVYKLEKSGCDILFLPDTKEIYPQGTENKIHYDIGYLENILEGKYRPGHFQGVCQVMEVLLNAVQPDELFLGQKDYQQCLVIKKLAAIIKNKVEIRICPTTREESGLAMSSRNMRLNISEKQNASEIYKTLLFINKNFGKEPHANLQNSAFRLLEKKGFKVDYIEMVNAKNLLPLQESQHEKAVFLIAAFLHDVRLIDNMLYGEEDINS